VLSYSRLLTQENTQTRRQRDTWCFRNLHTYYTNN